MKKMIDNVALIEGKIGSLDVLFLKQIRQQLSYQNPYYLVCFNEVVCDAMNNSSIEIKSLSFCDLLDYLNQKAEHLYLNSNISESLQLIMQGKNGEE